MDHPFKASAQGTEQSTNTRATRPTDVNYYQIINASPDSTPRAIREAYIRTKSGFSASQDVTYSLFSNEDLQKTLSEIDEAFRVLSDPTSKSRYDASIGLGSGRDLVTGKTFNDVERTKRATFGVAAFSGQGDSQLYSPPPPEPASANWMQNVEESNGLYLFETMNMVPTQAEKRGPIPVTSTVKVSRKIGEVDTSLLDELCLQLADPLTAEFGSKLVKLRELFGVSQEEIIERTKINITYIVALEADRLSEMPKPIYTKGFLRNYLKYLGIQNSEAIVTAYMCRFTPVTA